MSFKDLEEVDQPPYAEGCLARKTGQKISKCPYQMDQLRKRCSWLAGWNDTDAELIRKKGQLKAQLI